MAEVVDAFLAVAFAINNGGHFEPDQITFVVIVGAPAPIKPTSCESEPGLSDSGVEQRTPSASGPAGAEGRRDAGHGFVILPGSPQTAPSREHGAQIIR